MCVYKLKAKSCKVLSFKIVDTSTFGLISGKWVTSFENWPWQRFPVYFQGAGLVIAGSAVRPILSAIQVTPYFIWEDLYLVGLCAVKAKVTLRTSNQYNCVR